MVSLLYELQGETEFRFLSCDDDEQMVSDLVKEPCATSIPNTLHSLEKKRKVLMIRGLGSKN